MTSSAKTPKSGLPFALGAYAIWGAMPIYIKLLGALACVFGLKQWNDYRAAMTQPRLLGVMLLSSALISINWTVYMWAVMHQQVLATSLGYYLNPLVNVLLGRIVLKERLNRPQALAVGVAATGVGIMLFQEPGAIWISLTLALSFGSYGLVRKMAPVSAVPGLATEVTLLAPLACLALAGGLATEGGFGSSTSTSLLLMGSGIITAIPLLMFATAARRMSYTALGFVQYTSPTIVFFLSIFVWHEPINAARLACFALIWTAIAIFSVDALHRARKPAVEPVPLD